MSDTDIPTCCFIASASDIDRKVAVSGWKEHSGSGLAEFTVLVQYKLWFEYNSYDTSVDYYTMPWSDFGRAIADSPSTSPSASVAFDQISELQSTLSVSASAVYNDQATYGPGVAYDVMVEHLTYDHWGSDVYGYVPYADSYGSSSSSSYYTSYGSSGVYDYMGNYYSSYTYYPTYSSIGYNSYNSYSSFAGYNSYNSYSSAGGYNSYTSFDGYNSYNSYSSQSTGLFSPTYPTPAPTVSVATAAPQNEYVPIIFISLQFTNTLFADVSVQSIGAEFDVVIRSTLAELAG